MIITKPSSDLHRAAELAARNEERLAAYYERRALHAPSVDAALARVERGLATASDAALLRAVVELFRRTKA